MKAYTQNKTQKLLTRLLLAVMLLAILGCSMTACASGGAKITTVTKQGSISVPAGNKISDKIGRAHV